MQAVENGRKVVDDMIVGEEALLGDDVILETHLAMEEGAWTGKWMMEHELPLAVAPVSAMPCPVLETPCSKDEPPDDKDEAASTVCCVWFTCAQPPLAATQPSEPTFHRKAEAVPPPLPLPDEAKAVCFEHVSDEPDELVIEQTSQYELPLDSDDDLLPTWQGCGRLSVRADRVVHTLQTDGRQWVAERSTGTVGWTFAWAHRTQWGPVRWRSGRVELVGRGTFAPVGLSLAVVAQHCGRNPTVLFVFEELERLAVATASPWRELLSSRLALQPARPSAPQWAVEVADAIVSRASCSAEAIEAAGKRTELAIDAWKAEVLASTPRAETDAPIPVALQQSIETVAHGLGSLAQGIASAKEGATSLASLAGRSVGQAVGASLGGPSRESTHSMLDTPVSLDYRLLMRIPVGMSILRTFCTRACTCPMPHALCPHTTHPSAHAATCQATCPRIIFHMHRSAQRSLASATG